MSKVKGKHRQHNKVNKRRDNSRKNEIYSNEETCLEESLEKLSTDDIGKCLLLIFYFALYNNPLIPARVMLQRKL